MSKRKPWDESYFSRINPKNHTESEPEEVIFSDYGVLEKRVMDLYRGQSKSWSFGALYGNNPVASGKQFHDLLQAGQDRRDYAGVWVGDDYTNLYTFKDTLRKAYPVLYHHVKLLEKAGISGLENILAFCRNPYKPKYIRAWEHLRASGRYNHLLNKRLLTAHKAMEYL